MIWVLYSAHMCMKTQVFRKSLVQISAKFLLHKKKQAVAHFHLKLHGLNSPVDPSDTAQWLKVDFLKGFVYFML